MAESKHDLPRLFQARFADSVYNATAYDAENATLTKPPPKQPTRFFVYVLGSQGKNDRHIIDRRTYVGWTTDLDRRLQRHNAGTGAKSTRGRTWTLLYSECCKTRNEAMSREWHIKRDRKFRTTLRAAMNLADKQTC